MLDNQTGSSAVSADLAFKAMKVVTALKRKFNNPASGCIEYEGTPRKAVKRANITPQQYSVLCNQIEAEIPRLRCYARCLTNSRADAEDLIQSSLVKSLKKLRSYKNRNDLRRQIFSIMQRQHVYLRKKTMHEQKACELSELLPVYMPNPGQCLELRDLDRALGRLPEEQRTVILLVGLEGMRYEAVAEILRIPVGTVRSRLSRGREALRRLMGIVEDRQANSVMLQSIMCAKAARETTSGKDNPGAKLKLGNFYRGPNHLSPEPGGLTPVTRILLANCAPRG